MTSHLAARGVNVTTRQLLVLRILREHPRGLTSSEIATHANLPRDSVSPRIPALVAQRLVMDTEVRRESFGLRPQIVWRLTPIGVAALETGHG